MARRRGRRRGAWPVVAQFWAGAAITVAVLVLAADAAVDADVGVGQVWDGGAGPSAVDGLYPGLDEVEAVEEAGDLRAVTSLAQFGGGEDRFDVTDVRVEIGGPPFRVTGQKRASVNEHDRIMVRVDDASVGRDLLCDGRAWSKAARVIGPARTAPRVGPAAPVASGCRRPVASPR